MNSNAEEYKKLYNFRETVMRQTKNEIEAVNGSAEAETKRIIEAAENEALATAYNKITKQTKEIKAELQREVSKKSFEASRAVLNRRNELVDAFFAEVSDELVAFTTSEEYAAFLNGCLFRANKILPLYDGVVLYARPADMERAKEAAALFPFLRIAEEKSIKLGGLTFFYPNEGRYVDETLDARLEKEKRDFSATAELKL